MKNKKRKKTEEKIKKALDRYWFVILILIIIVAIAIFYSPVFLSFSCKSHHPELRPKIEKYYIPTACEKECIECSKKYWTEKAFGGIHDEYDICRMNCHANLPPEEEEKCADICLTSLIPDEAEIDSATICMHTVISKEWIEACCIYNVSPELPDRILCANLTEPIEFDELSLTINDVEHHLNLTKCSQTEKYKTEECCE